MELNLSNLPTPNEVAPTSSALVPDQASTDRDTSFQNLASLSLEDAMKDGVYSPTGVRRQEAEQREREEQIRNERLDSIAPMVDEIAKQQSISPEARAAAINQITNDVLIGTHPEEIAREEILNQEMEFYDDINDQLTQSRVALEIADERSVNEALAQALTELEEATDPTIPYLETGVEFVTAEVLGFLRSGAFNINEMIEHGMGINANELSPTASTALEKAFDKAQDMTPAERVEAINKMKDFALKQQGILLDNGFDADNMSAAIQAIFGSKMQNASAVSQNFWMQWFGVLTSGTAGAAVKGVKGIKGVKGKPDFGDLPDPDSTVSDAVEGEFIPGKPDAPTPPPSTTRVGRDRTIDSTAERIVDRAVLTGPQGEPKTGIPAGTPAQVLSESAPNAAKSVLEAAAQDPTLAKRLGTTPVQIVEESIVPKMGNEARRRSPSILFRSIESELDPVLSKLRNNNDLPLQFEVDDLKDELFSKIKEDETVKIHLSQLDMDDPTALNVNYALGKPSGVGFATKEEALELLQRIPHSEQDAVAVLGYNPKKNRYEPDIDGPEYLLQVRYRRPFSKSAQAERVFKPDRGSVGGLTNHLDSTVRYIQRVADSITRIDLVSAKVGDRLTDILSPLKEIKNVGVMDEMWRVLKQEELKEAEYGPQFLRERFKEHPEGLDGYYSVRRFYKQVWALRNSMYRDHLQRSGYMSFRGADGELAFARPFRGSTEEINTFWYDKESRIMSRADAEKAGLEFQFLESHIPKGDDDYISNYIGVPAGKNVLEPLPTAVLKEKKGYLGRNLNTKYIVYKKGTINDNGSVRPHTEAVVKVADDPIVAEEWAARNPAKFGVRPAREVTDYKESGINKEIQNLATLGLMTHTRGRGNLKNLDLTYEHALDSPEQLLSQVKFNISRTVGLDQFIDYSSNKWMKTYGHLVKNEAFPWTGDILPKTNDTVERSVLREAEIYRDKIRLVAGMDDTDIGRSLSHRILGFAEDMAIQSVNLSKRGARRKMREIASKSASAIAGFNPVSFSKKTGHIMFIALNASRQLAMQSATAPIYAGVKHGSTYFTSQAALADAITMMMLKMTKDVDSQAFENIVTLRSKLSKQDPKFYRQMYEHMEDSGILSSVSSHQFMEFGARRSTTWRQHSGNYAGDQPRSGISGKVHLGKNASASALNLSSKYGFELGEKVNRMFAFLAVRNKHVQDGTLAEMDAFRLGTEAAQIAQNMGSANKAQFQSGEWYTPFLQFQSHGIKMLQFVMPNIAATKNFSLPIDGKTKARMLAWNTVWFGAAGYGLSGPLGTMWDDYIAEKSEEGLIEPDTEAEEIAKYGLNAYAFSKSVEAMTQSELNTTASGTLSPFGSILSDAGLVGLDLDDGGRASNPFTMVGAFVHKSLTTGTADLYDLAGVPGGLVKTGVKTVDNILNIAGAEGFSTGERVEQYGMEAIRLIPMFNNAVQAKLIATTGAYVDRYGSPVLQATAADAFVKLLLGENHDDVGRIYRMRAEWLGRFAGEEPSDRELLQTGKDLGNEIAFMTRRVHNGELNSAQLQESSEALVSMLRETYKDDPFAMNVVWDAANKTLERAQDNEGRDMMTRFIEAIADDSDLLVEHGLDGVISKLNQLKSPKAQLLSEELQKIKSNLE